MTAHVSAAGELLQFLDQVSCQSHIDEHEEEIEQLRHLIQLQGDDAFAWPLHKHFTDEGLLAGPELDRGEQAVLTRIQSACKELDYYVCLANIERITEVNKEITYSRYWLDFDYDERPEETYKCTAKTFVDSEKFSLFGSVKLPFDNLLDEDYFSNEDPDHTKADDDHDERFKYTFNRTVSVLKSFWFHTFFMLTQYGPSLSFLCLGCLSSSNTGILKTMQAFYDDSMSKQSLLYDVDDSLGKEILSVCKAMVAKYIEEPRHALGGVENETVLVASICRLNEEDLFESILPLVFSYDENYATAKRMILRHDHDRLHKMLNRWLGNIASANSRLHKIDQVALLLADQD
ncbi:uncharacterized protein LY89DRAFT_789939, partial [Mollisia scopiformis]